MTIAGMSIAFAVLALMGTATVEAQMPSHEFGVDLGVTRTQFEGDGNPVFGMGTPIDVRIGFVTQRSWMLETRFTFRYATADDVSRLDLGPGLNLMWRPRVGTGMAKQLGPYFTGGASAEVTRIASEAFDADVRTRLGINVGVGTRMGWGTAAFRPELFFERNFGSGDRGEFGFFPGYSTIGIRVGLSFWR